MSEPINNKRIAALVFKYLLQKLSDSEQQELDEWIAESEQHQIAFTEMTHRASLPLKLEQYNEVDTEGIWLKIANQAPDLTMATVTTSPPLYRNIWFRLGIAASAIAVIAIGGWYFTGNNAGKNSTPKLSATTVKNDVAPGGNKAVLTLADGRTIVLDNAQNGSLATQGSTAILKQQDQVTYQSGSSNNGEILYNTISTPRGGQFHVTLPDGTNVWLNAASSIHFPTQFNGSQRKVSVSGEAYFEVRKDPTKPFIVAITPSPLGEGRGEVEVLGTHFNVNAYSDENNINTTLLEGSIKFTNNAQRLTQNAERNTNVVVLKPGQQAILNNDADKASVVNSNDANASISWVKGVFHFEKANLGNVMRQLSRWYDVQVAYEGTMPHQTITGDVERNIPLSELLSILEQMGKAHYVIQGKTVKVMP